MMNLKRKEKKLEMIYKIKTRKKTNKISINDSTFEEIQ